VSFSHPGWLAAGLAVCLCLLWIWRRYDVRQHAALTRFVSPQLSTQLTQSVSIGRRRLRRGLLLASLALLFAALAGPSSGITGRRSPAAAMKSFSPWILRAACRHRM